MSLLPMHQLSDSINQERENIEYMMKSLPKTQCESHYWKVKCHDWNGQHRLWRGHGEEWNWQKQRWVHSGIHENHALYATNTKFQEPGNRKWQSLNRCTKNIIVLNLVDKNCTNMITQCSIVTVAHHTFINACSSQYITILIIHKSVNNSSYSL